MHYIEMHFVILSQAIIRLFSWDNVCVLFTWRKSCLKQSELYRDRLQDEIPALLYYSVHISNLLLSLIAWDFFQLLAWMNILWFLIRFDSFSCTSLSRILCNHWNPTAGSYHFLCCMPETIYVCKGFVWTQILLSTCQNICRLDLTLPPLLIFYIWC